MFKWSRILIISRAHRMDLFFFYIWTRFWTKTYIFLFFYINVLLHFFLLKITKKLKSFLYIIKSFRSNTELLNIFSFKLGINYLNIIGSGTWNRIFYILNRWFRCIISNLSRLLFFFLWKIINKFFFNFFFWLIFFWVYLCLQKIWSWP
jgi:hypothetical protein